MKKTLSIILTLSMLFTLLPERVLVAEEYMKISANEEIVAFAPLEKTEKTVTLGTPIEDLELPEILTATVRSNLDTVTDRVYGFEEETTVDIPVTWTSQPGYDMDTEGEYVFTPVIEGYTVSPPLPQITVTVRTVMTRQAFSLMSSDNVAQIVETGYPCPTVQDAVYAVADGQTIQLLKNITISEPDSIEIKDDKSFTIDLNGYVISSSSVGTAISHSGSGTLTITDSSSTKSGKITATYCAIVLERGCSGSLLVIGDTVNSTGGGRSAIHNDSESAQVSIEGGAVTGANVAITNKSTGSISVSGGSVTTAGFAAIYNQSGSVSLSGGSVTSTASNGPAIWCELGSKTYISGDAKITSANDGTGSYKGTICLAISGAAAEFEVTGGTIENTHESGTAIHINSGTVEIPSGSPVIKGGGEAMNKAPNLSGYTDVFILGSTTSTEGVEAAEITKADIDTNEKVQTYKYLEFGPATTPGAPTGLAATPNDGQLTLTWTAPAITGGSAIQHYEYSLDGVNWTSTGSADTSYTITGLTNGNSYTVKVRAVNGKGGGTESASITATLPYTDQEAIDAEAAKYAETAVIESNVAVGTDVTATMARLLTGETNDETPAFTDIKGHWAKADIEFVVSQGLFSGTSSTTFSPDTAMTRGMFVTVLGRLAKADVTSYQESSYTDVKKDLYYLGFIEWASQNGIVKGMEDKKFASDQAITREQMEVIMSNYAKNMNLKFKQVDEEKHFADDDKISTYAKEAVKEMQMAGLLRGKDNNQFDPQGRATRAEVSSVLHRYMEITK